MSRELTLLEYTVQQMEADHGPSIDHEAEAVDVLEALGLNPQMPAWAFKRLINGALTEEANNVITAAIAFWESEEAYAVAAGAQALLDAVSWYVGIKTNLERARRGDGCEP